MSKVAIQGNASGTGTFTIAAPNSNTDRTLTLPDEAGTVLTSATDIAATATNVIQNSGSAFRAILPSTQSVTAQTWTKVALSTENFDAESDFDNATNYRFTPQIEGYYQMNGAVILDYTVSPFTYGVVSIYKNGSRHSQTFINLASSSSTGYFELNVSDLIYFNGSTDYAELYGYIHNGSGLRFYGDGSPQNTYFSGCLVRRV